MDSTAATKTNEGILEFLRYYVDPDRELDYAVLVAGPWGSGKTHLVKAFLEAAGVKQLYVSLYGLTSTAQIDQELYRQLHPLLASKGMRVFGAIARGALKGTLKIDLTGDGKDDGSWSAAIPEIDLTKELSNPRERLLVFDDLERVKMPVSEVLGYINSFVEHDGLKAIILANEEEIVRHVDARYPDIKEKLIGQTLSIAAPADTAFDAFVETIQDSKTRAFLMSHKADVLAMHAAGGLNNLRMLKQSMWDFERVARHFEDRHWALPSASLQIMNIVLALSLEHRSGRLQAGQITKLIGNSFGRLFRSQVNNEETPEHAIEDRYKQLDFDNAVLDAALLEAVIVRGESNGEAVRASLDASSNYATPEHQPLWLRAWNAFTADDLTVDAVVAELEQAFSDRTFHLRAELMHVFGIRLWFARLGLIHQTAEQVVAESKAYVDDLERTGNIVSTLDDKRPDADSVFSSRGVLEADNPQYQDIAEYYALAALRASERQYPQIARDLLAKLETSPQEFMLDLVPNNIRASPYYDVPVLAALPAAELAEFAVRAAPDIQMQLIQTIGARHEHAPLDRLAPERAWLAELDRELRTRLDQARPMTRHRLQSYIERNIAPALTRYAEQERFVAEQASATSAPPESPPIKPAAKRRLKRVTPDPSEVANNGQA